jgi:GxxExxY protein
MEVHNILGPGFPEEYYQRALEYEFTIRKIPFDAQKLVLVHYKDIRVGMNYLDFVIEDTLILELKSTYQIDNVHRSQIIKYFASTEYPVAIIANFGNDKFMYEKLFPPEKIQKGKKYKIKY